MTIDDSDWDVTITPVGGPEGAMEEQVPKKKNHHNNKVMLIANCTC